MLNKFALMILSYLLTSTAYAQTPDIQEGLWEVSSQASIVGMPMQMPEMSVKQCFTKQSMNPENILQHEGCKINNMDVQSNRVDWDMTCHQEGMVMQGSGNIQYQKTSFSGTFAVIMSNTGQGNINMQTKLSGRYIGQCP